MTFTVRPAATGGWLAFASGPRLLVVAAPDSVDVAASWAAIGADNGFQASLDLLTGKGLAATPHFLLVEWESGGSARVVVRGETELTVTDAAGEQSLSASGVSTWVERSLPAVTGIAFAVPGAEPAGTVELPLASGVALVASIASAGVDVPAARPAPAAAPAPAATPTAVAPPAPTVPEVDVEATVREAPDAFVVPPAAASTEPAEGGYDYLFGETMYRGVADAAVHVPDPETEADSEAEGSELHDGETVLTSDIAKIRGKRKRKPASSESPPPPPPQKLVLVLPTGAREPLTQPVLIGRSPSVSKVSGGQIPRLLTVGTADQDISRNHAQFALEGGTVVVTDLHSRNGTSIRLPGKNPQKLRAGEPTSVIVGTVVDLGGGITVTVDEDA